MLALRFSQFGTPAVLHVEELARPVAGPGEVVVEVYAASINPSDVKNVAGGTPQTRLPRTPGRDFAGVVVEGEKQLLGKEVWGTGGDIGFVRDGSHAQYLLLPQEAVHEKPHRLSFLEAGAVGTVFVTAWLALCTAGMLSTEDVVLIIGALGSVGGSAVQIARWRGAKVIGFVHREEQRQPVQQLGADHVIVAEADQLREAVMDLTGGCGATLVFDTVGGEMFEPCLGTLAQRGRQIEIATTSTMPRVSFSLRDFYHRETHLIGVDSLQLTVSDAGTILEKLKEPFEEALFLPPQSLQACELEDAPQAYEHAAKGIKEKLVIVPHKRERKVQ